MRNFVVYEHIVGLPEYLDTVQEEITEYATENYFSEKQVEKYVEEINNIQTTDKHERKRNLYVYWY